MAISLMFPRMLSLPREHDPDKEVESGEYLACHPSTELLHSAHNALCILSPQTLPKIEIEVEPPEPGEPDEDEGMTMSLTRTPRSKSPSRDSVCALPSHRSGATAAAGATEAIKQADEARQDRRNWRRREP